MDFYRTFGRIARFGLSVALFVTAIHYVEDTMLDIKIVEIAKEIKGEISLQLDDMDVKLAFHSNKLILSIEA